MNNWLQHLKNELFGGWKPFEVIWIFLFLAAQIFAYIQEPDSLLAMISGIAGILCVVFVGKGKISNYLFGLIFAYTYFYVSLDNKFYGEMTTTLYVETKYAQRKCARSRGSQISHDQRLGNINCHCSYRLHCFYQLSKNH